MNIELTPISPLMIEHRLIERMVSLVYTELDKMSVKKSPDIEFINQAIDFAKTYTHRCHHGKEEEILFKILAFKKLTPEHKKMMDDLVLEHIQGMRIINGLEEGKEAFVQGRAEAVKAIPANLKKWAEFYPGHIRKEEEVFFKPSMEYFSKQEQEEILHKFSEFDKYLIHEKYIKTIEGLEGAREHQEVKPYL